MGVKIESQITLKSLYQFVESVSFYSNISRKPSHFPPICALPARIHLETTVLLSVPCAQIGSTKTGSESQIVNPGIKTEVIQLDLAFTVMYVWNISFDSYVEINE